MVKLRAEADCKISFRYKGKVIKFDFKQGEVINKVDKFIINRLINTNLVKKIKE